VKVYLSTRGEYSDYRVCHAFARREDAEADPLGDDVLELELLDGPADVRPWYMLSWNTRMRDAAGRYRNPHVWSENRDYDGSEAPIRHHWSGQYPDGTPMYLNVQGWDRDLVMKVYGEQRGQYLARKEGVS
jgi:hypothetical protein